MNDIARRAIARNEHVRATIVGCAAPRYCDSCGHEVVRLKGDEAGCPVLGARCHVEMGTATTDERALVDRYPHAHPEMVAARAVVLDLRAPSPQTLNPVTAAEVEIDRLEAENRRLQGLLGVARETHDQLSGLVSQHGSEVDASKANHCAEIERLNDDLSLAQTSAERERAELAAEYERALAGQARTIETHRALVASLVESLVREAW